MFRSIFFVATLAVLCITVASVGATPDRVLMNKLVKEYIDNTKKRLPHNGTCTANNLVVRKEWYLRLSPSPVILFLGSSSHG